MKNRLKLDFNLESAEDRLNFINGYIGQFTDLTSAELETISKYLLWGKDKDGKPLGADVELETKWTKTNDIDSLDSLIESQTFNDLQINSLSDATIYKKPRVVFDRAKVRKTAPPHLLWVFESLWAKIDETELLINYYELKTGKRTKEPREELLKKFSSDEQDEIRGRASKLNQYQYLKRRHDLIELRKQQFSLKDSFVTTINPFGTAPTPKFGQTLTFDYDVEVFPLGLKEGAVGQLIFDKNFDPRALNEQQLRLISNLLQRKQKFDTNQLLIDFRDCETVYQLYLYREELLNQIEEEQEAHRTESNLDKLLDTLKFYEEIADLNETQREILEMKAQHTKNQDIASYINKKYGKSYTANYISTIFKQKIIVKINEAAALHKDTIENCFFPENFKTCSCCGSLLLLDGRNWVKKARSKDGFQNKCKKCERESRKIKKEVNKS